MPCYLLGIDVGTLSTKAILFDEKGTIMGRASKEYGILTPKPSWIEQDPEIWWRAVRDTVKLALKKAKARGEDVKCIGISVLTPAVIPVDEKGTALRNSILMIDQRSMPQAKWMKERIGEDRIFEVTGNRIAPGTFSAPSILWMKDNEPKMYEKTHKFLNVNGFIVNRLTGEFTSDYTQASASLLFDIRGIRWSEELCNTLEISMDKLPSISPSSKIVGTLSPKAGKELKLSPDIPVSAGANDTSCACVGTGTVRNGATLLSIGTTVTFTHVTEDPRFDLRLLNRLHSVPGLFLMMGAISTGGLAYRWLRDNIYIPEKRKARKEKGDPYRMMDEEAENSPLGAGGIVVLPYFSGERSPIWNPNARGMLFGLSLHHTRSDVIRAFLEGVAYCIRDVLEVLRSRGIILDEIRVGGGGARSRLWRQIIADVLGVTLLRPRVDEAAALGAAIGAGVGSGIYHDFTICDKLISCEAGERPSVERSTTYLKYYKLFKNLYDSVEERYEELKSIED